MSLRTVFEEPDLGGGSGSALHPAVLLFAFVCTVVATVVSFVGIYQHLKNYRNPTLQRMVIRIMIMVPIYGIASFISLVSLEAAFVIDAIRDIYEAFVIYCFFQLLIGALGGERSLLILLHGRPPKYHIFPVSLFRRELDASDPHVFLSLKRGIMHVQVKPVLAFATIILKAFGKYNEGDMRPNTGYFWIAIVYNVSICISLYCLGMLWMVVNDDLKAFRPMPKFLCVKGILFFSFWQALGISILVAAGAIRQLGPYTDGEHISLALTDSLLCFEMPLFAIAHIYAFSSRDYEDKTTQYAARLRFWYALRDAAGIRDLIDDFRVTFRGDGFAYRTYEPAEGAIHQGLGRERRIRAGLRYAEGGKKKYWLPMPDSDATTDVRNALPGAQNAPYAPLGVPETNDGVVHNAPDLEDDQDNDTMEDPLLPNGGRDAEDETLVLRFDPPSAEEDMLYQYSRGMMFGDYGYPVVDVSSERARAAMWEEEERILRDQRAAAFSPVFGTPLPPERRDPTKGGYGAVGQSQPRAGSYFPATASASDSPLSPTQIRGAPVIDLEHNRIPDMPEDGATSGLRLSWARTGSPRAGTTQAARGSPQAHRGSPGTPKGHAHRDVNRAGTPVEIIEDRDDATPGSSGSLDKSKAVDLIVEDHEAEQEIRAHLRRKGEPVLKSNLTRVYRREYDSPERSRNKQRQREEDDSPVDEGLIEAVQDGVEAVVGEVVDREDIVSPTRRDDAFSSPERSYSGWQSRDQQPQQDQRQGQGRGGGRAAWFNQSGDDANPWA